MGDVEKSWRLDVRKTKKVGWILGLIFVKSAGKFSPNPTFHGAFHWSNLSFFDDSRTAWLKLIKIYHD